MSEVKKALITGILGQDGIYLAKLLHEKGYEVDGLTRELDDRKDLHSAPVHFIEMDITEEKSIQGLIEKKQYHDIYHLAGQSSVVNSFKIPKHTFQVNTIGTLNILESMRVYSKHTRLFFASSSEIFGGIPVYSPQNENTPFHPKSPYGVSKSAGHNLITVYREAFELNCCSGILFNHESPFRPDTFLTKKVSNWVKQYHQNGLSEPLELGNINARRDWGHCEDMTRAMYMMLNSDSIEEPFRKKQAQFEDYVIGNGQSHSIKEFIEVCFKLIEKEIHWKSEGYLKIHFNGNEVAIPNENAYDSKGQEIININPKFWRPNEVKEVKANPEKIKTQLGWSPNYNLEMIIAELLNLKF